MFMSLVVRLFRLQIINGEEYLRTYLQIATRELDIPGVRGNIYDRNGNVLAYNELVYVVTIRDNGDMYYTTTSKTSHNRFLCNIFGLKTPDQLTGPEGKFPADISARELFENRFHYYKLDELKDNRGNPIIMTEEEALQIVDIWYTMGLTAYKRCEAVRISSYISEIAMVDILENSSQLPGVKMEELTIRRYNDSTYFSPIVGYVGKMQEGQLEKLRQENPEYASDDIVGKSGIEMVMETTLQGTKGHQSVYVDSVGHIREVTSQTAPRSRHDVYLTLDRDLQKGIYHLIEQQLAGIVVSKLVNNQVISLESLKTASAAGHEARVFETFYAARTDVLETLRNELYSSSPTAQCELPEDIAGYMSYVVSFLSAKETGVLENKKIDKNSREYQAWADKTGNLREYLYAGIHGG